MKKIFGRLPASLQVIFVMLLNVPVWAGIFLASPLEVYHSQGAVWAAVHTLTYFVGPLAVCAAMLGRSFLLLPTFAVECLALILQAVSEHAAATSAAYGLRYAMIGVMLVIGVVVIDKDILYPFFTRNSRLWRRAARLYANRRLQVRTDAGGIAVMMQDCSLTGIGFSGERQALSAFLSGKPRGADVQLVLPVGARSAEVTGRLAWRRDEGALCHVGVEIDDATLMAELIGSLDPPRHAHPARQWVAKNWARTSFRRAAIGIWSASLAGSFISPACGANHSSHRAGGVAATTRSAAAKSHVGQVSANHGFGLSGDTGDLAKEGIALAYTGIGLACTKKGGATIRLGEFLPQDQLLGHFQADQNWFQQLLASLEESDATGTRRPTTAVHAQFLKRLHLGVDPRFWHLNLVRIRYNSVVQIKINYELDVWAAAAHDSLGFAAIIHSIAIRPEDVGEFTQDVNAIPQSEDTSGCYMQTFLTKWLARGSYFFAHTNVLDRQRDEWVFTESKPVTNDLTPVRTGCANIMAGCSSMGREPSGMGGDRPQTSDPILSEGSGMAGAASPGEATAGMPPSGGAPAAMTPSVTGGAGGAKPAESSGMMSSETGSNQRESNAASEASGAEMRGNAMVLSSATGMPTSAQIFRMPMMSDTMALSDGGDRVVLGPYDNPAGGKPRNVALRIAAMAFQQQVWHPSTQTVSPDQSGASQIVWFSGTTSDEQLPPLVTDEQGKALGLDHLAFGSEASFRCADCHARITQSFPDPGADPRFLGIGGANFFRHVGFGGNEIGGASEPLGVVRQNDRAVLSPYLMDVARARPHGTLPPGGLSLYKPLGTVPSDACDPGSGCGGCATPTKLTYCLHDAVQEALLEPATATHPVVDYSALRNDVVRLGNVCADDADAGLVDASQCGFLGCVAAQAESGASMTRTIFGRAVVDPTYGCEFDLMLRPN